MYFLFSGEGPSDFGSGKYPMRICEGDDYYHGPMAEIVDQVVDKRFNYSIIQFKGCGFVSEQKLSEKATKLRRLRKGMILAGKKRAKETGYFYRNARALACLAKEKARQSCDEVVAVLFRDSDGTASCGRGIWQEKWQSMLDGFREESFLTGVPMIPKPKSEAWILCALKDRPYQSCEKLEARSGNDDSPNSLKEELERRVGRSPSREDLCHWLKTRKIDVRRIDMPSFLAFRNRLESVL